MATTDMKTAGTEEGQKEKTLSPSEEEATPVLHDISAQLNFSELTPGQFGISEQSFIPSSSNRKGTSRLMQIKARRRSSVGVRGSPETNSLIRFMAEQRMRTPTNKTSEHVRSSPFLPRVAFKLRQKMASFQSLMAVEESEVCDAMPSQDSDGGGCIKRRDYLSDNDGERGKENNQPMTPTPSKRRCLGPREGCEVEIREASAPILHFSLKEQKKDEEPVKQGKTLNPELPPVCQAQPDDPVMVSPTQPASPFHISSLPSLLEMEPKENDSTSASTVKKKRVRFGGPLSPELFDKTLPPSTPLLKGGTPARAPTPGAGFRSLLKTPQRGEALPDLSSPTVSGASPVFAIPGNRRRASVRKHNEEEDDKIVFPSIDEADSAVMNGTGDPWEAQPLNLNSASHEVVTESDTTLSTASQMDGLDEPACLPEKKTLTELPGPECDSTSVAPARCSTRKRKQPEESRPVRRSTRSAAKSAPGKMKCGTQTYNRKITATRQWNRSVDRSLYGSREYASKNPTLSPITERLSLISQSSAAQQSHSLMCTVTDQETRIHPDAHDTQGDHPVTNPLESPSEEGVASLHSSKENATGKESRVSGLRARGRRLKKRKVSVVDCDLLSEESQHPSGEETVEHSAQKTATNTEASNAVPVEHAVPKQGGADIEADTQTPSTDRTSECHASLSVCPSSAEELSYTLNVPKPPAQRKARRGRRSSAQHEQGEDQLSYEVEGKGHGHQASSQHESRSISDSQDDEGVANLHLAPWQADFNFEDVFKPVTTRGQRSVRRSLRNQSNTVPNSNSAGLAWMPLHSPDCSDPRGKTRSRRLSAALPVQPSFPEETQANAS